MSKRLRKEFVELLEKDVEFRYTVAGYLGMLELLKRLDSMEASMQKLWEEVKTLREGQEKLWEAQNKLWEEVRALRRDHERLRGYVVSGFGELRLALGVTFEMHTAAYIEVILDEMGYAGAKVEKKYLVYEGEVLDIDVFSEVPLVVGEVTTSVRDVESASNEVEKLMKRVKAVEEIYGRRPDLVILSVGTAPKEAADRLREESEGRGVRLIMAREIEEALRV